MITPDSGGEPSPLTSAALFGFFADQLSDGSDFEKKTKELKPLLQEQGFSTSNDIVWRHVDDSGIVLVLLFSKSRSSSVIYSPPEPVRLDPAIATLIGKTHVEFEDGDVVVLSTYADGRFERLLLGSGRRNYLKFNLRDGTWVETGVHIRTIRWRARLFAWLLAAIVLWLIVRFVHLAWDNPLF